MYKVKEYVSMLMLEYDWKKKIVVKRKERLRKRGKFFLWLICKIKKKMESFFENNYWSLFFVL